MSEGRTTAWGTDAPMISAPRARRAAGTVGLLLDGRYRLEQRRTRDGSSSTWDGTDDQLGRPVGIRVVAGRTAMDAVDAARRSASLEDVRLARVLDVGSSQAADGGQLGWVISERTPGRPLADLLRASPMPASRVRAIIGEAAAALARANSVGLHHRRLDPSTVMVSDAGDVVVTGLEVAAAAAGLSPTRSDQARRAEREDAVGLVSLMYAGLTGLWPHGRFSALGAAPTSDGVPVPPGDLVGGVPADLDALVSATLGLYDDGPASPAELADQLTPWGHAGSGRASAATGVPLTDLTGGGGESTDLRGADETDLRDEVFDALGATAPHPPMFDDAAFEAAPAFDDAAFQAAPEAPQVVASPVAPRPRDGRAAQDRPVPSHQATRAASALSASDEGDWPQGWEESSDWDSRPDPAPGMITGGWSSGQSPSRRDPVRHPSAGNGVGVGAGRFVMAVVFLAVIALVVLAGMNVRRIGGVLGVTSAATTSSSSAPAVTPKAGSATGTSTGASSGASAAVKPTVVAITADHPLDPMGDGSENDAQASRAIDGDPATAWTSSTYKTASFGGLKAGLGLDLDLPAGATASSLDLRVAGTGGSVQVRSSADGTYAGSTLLATAAVGGPGGAPVHVALPKPTTTSHLILWFTALPQTTGGFSAQVADVAVH